MSKDHGHKFVIPIEWEYGYQHLNIKNESAFVWRRTFDPVKSIAAKRVSKLMCECGEVKQL